jgi:hypothetical protein
MSGLTYYGYNNITFDSTGSFQPGGNNINIFNSNINNNNYATTGIVTTINTVNNQSNLFSTYGFNNTTNIALKIKGYFTPNVGGNWQFLLGYKNSSNTYTPNDDITYLWIGNSALSPTSNNVTGMQQFGLSATTITVPLEANVHYPILIYWGQALGGYIVSFGIIPPGGTITYDGTPYFTQTNMINGLTYYAYDTNPYTNQGFNIINQTNFSFFNNNYNRTGTVATINIVNNQNNLFNTYGFSNTQSIALKFKGYFIPNVSGDWKFLLGNNNTQNPNDDISYLWIGNAALNPTSGNSLGTSNAYTINPPFTNCYSRTIQLTQNVRYPILMYWGQGNGAYYVSLGIINPSGTLTYDGTPYFRPTERSELEQIGLTNITDQNYFDNINTLDTATNDSTTSDIIQAINENLAELTLVQNQMNMDNNINQEILIKKQQLLKFKNDDLMKQLQELEIIESNITNKDKIIQSSFFDAIFSSQ